jgi:tetratricopeptide (TPR) repeat protein
MASFRVRQWALSAALGLLIAPPVRAHGDLHEQISALSKQIEADPANAALWFKRGELHRFHEDYAASLADLRRAAEIDPKLEVVDLAVGRTHLAAGDARAAKDALDRYLDRRPGHADARIERARALVKLGDGPAAAEEYTKALAAVERPLPEHYIERAEALAGLGRIDEAVRGLDEGLKRLGPVVTLQLRAIDLEASAKNFDAALARLDAAAAPFPRRESWLARKGDLLVKAGRPGEARAAYAAALAALDSLPPARRAARATADLEKRLRAFLEVKDEKP